VSEVVEYVSLVDGDPSGGKENGILGLGDEQHDDGDLGEVS
jgi:hypothetical protein